MPQVGPNKLRQLKRKSTLAHISAGTAPLPPKVPNYSIHDHSRSSPFFTNVPHDPKVLVYNLRTKTFRTFYCSTLLTQDVSKDPLQRLPMGCPPLLVDGKIQIVEVRKWELSVKFVWRTCDGERTRMKRANVRLVDVVLFPPFHTLLQFTFCRKHFQVVRFCFSFFRGFKND